VRADSVRARTATLAPAEASAQAVARPIPREAPVMRTFLLVRVGVYWEGLMKG
jgi:hypothetical protein